MLKKFYNYPQISDLVVTENGAAFKEYFQNGEINDHKRIKYLKDYLAAVLEAKKEGVNVKGYFVWTFTDSFEWAEGFVPASD